MSPWAFVIALYFVQLCCPRNTLALCTLLCQAQLHDAQDTVPVYHFKAQNSDHKQSVQCCHAEVTIAAYEAMQDGMMVAGAVGIPVYFVLLLTIRSSQESFSNVILCLSRSLPTSSWVRLYSRAAKSGCRTYPGAEQSPLH